MGLATPVNASFREKVVAQLAFMHRIEYFYPYPYN
mgnify:CR=1 FL=1|jgi:hypothetical protein